MAKKNRDFEQASLSFLDCICCGFGAIILLLVLAKTAEPMVLEQTREDLSGLLADLQEQLVELRGEVVVLDRTLVTKKEVVSKEEDRIARLQRLLSEIRGEFDEADSSANAIAKIQDQLEKARQELNTAQKSFDFQRPFEDSLVGGIPVDSEYIVFIIDTSGSMKSVAWPLVVAKVQETLAAYPEVKGIQVMNDMGEYMFRGRSGRWLNDSPRIRQLISQRLVTWSAFSNSSPVEGINKAIRTFYDPEKEISLYVFGDDFTGGSIERVVATVDRINKIDEAGNRRVRIHTVGFPVGFTRPVSAQRSHKRFANLMRILAERNGGTFVGLNNVR